MSLLRRREMMAEMEQEENVLYIYSGYLYVNGNVNDEPAFNSQYPNSVCSSVFPLKAGEAYTVTYSNATSRAARFYYPDGNYRTTAYSWNGQGTTVDGYVRLLGNQGAEITGMKIRKEDGTEIDYKIVDRR